MLKEKSFGIIPLRKKSGCWQVLLVKHGKGHWAFPKGHPEEGEKPLETASREFNEETGMRVKKMLAIPSQEEHYFFRQGADLIHKTVIYFVAEVEGKIQLQAAEISDYQWLSLEEASKEATFPQVRTICAKLIDYLQ